jgi:hypothetical protein
MPYQVEITDTFGGEYTLRPIGRNAPCWIMFVTWSDEPADSMEG